MKHILCILLACTLACLSCLPVWASPAVSEPSVSAESAILTLPSGTVLYEKNADKRMEMASTTKLMTALAVAEALPLSQTVTVSPEAVNVEGSSVYLCAGEQLTVEQLLYALLLSSANDAATALAIAADGSTEAFAERMNRYAERLGLTDTHFVNPHGLSHPEHYTTARELSLIAAELLRHEALSRIVSTYKATIPLREEKNARLLVNHNKLLRTYEGAFGMKTGFTKRSGRCLVSAAERDGLTLIGVTLNAPDDWRDHRQMLDYGFACYEAVTYAEAGGFSYALPIAGATEETAHLCNTEPLFLPQPRNAPLPTCTVETFSRVGFAPLPADTVLGRVTLTGVDGQTVSSPLVIQQPIEARPSRASLFQRFLAWLRRS